MTILRRKHLMNLIENKHLDMFVKRHSSPRLDANVKARAKGCDSLAPLLNQSAFWHQDKCRQVDPAEKMQQNYSLAAATINCQQTRLPGRNGLPSLVDNFDLMRSQLAAKLCRFGCTCRLLAHRSLVIKGNNDMLWQHLRQTLPIFGQFGAGFEALFGAGKICI